MLSLRAALRATLRAALKSRLKSRPTLDRKEIMVIEYKFSETSMIRKRYHIITDTFFADDSSRYISILDIPKALLPNDIIYIDGDAATIDDLLLAVSRAYVDAYNFYSTGGGVHA